MEGHYRRNVFLRLENRFKLLTSTKKVFHFFGKFMSPVKQWLKDMAILVLRFFKSRQYSKQEKKGVYRKYRRHQWPLYSRPPGYIELFFQQIVTMICQRNDNKVAN
jgi:hypothetical protein